MAINAAAIANHSLEWSAAAVSLGMTVEQGARRLRDGLEDFAVQRAEARTDLADTAVSDATSSKELHATQPSRVAKALWAQLISWPEDRC